MTNQVDTSQETIDMEWDKLEAEAGFTQEEMPGAEQEAANDPEAPAPNYPPMPVSEDMEVQITATAIEAGLRLAFQGIGGLKIPDEQYSKLADALAVVIVRRFGGLAEFLAQYGDLAMAGGAVISFIVAVINAVRMKKAELAAVELAKRKAEELAQEPQKPRQRVQANTAPVAQVQEAETAPVQVPDDEWLREAA